MYDSNHSPYETYCDFESEPPYVWTLIESLSLEEAQKTDNQNSFYIDHGLSQCRMTWSKFRVSIARMNTIKSSYGSTHYRATCNFDSEEGRGLVNRRDYVRGGLCNNDIFLASNNYGCRTVEYINIRGQMCRRCSVSFKVSTSIHLHIGLPQTISSCSNTAFNDTIANENVFGHYTSPNPLFSCAANQNSTTNWWVGGAWITEAF